MKLKDSYPLYNFKDKLSNYNSYLKQMLARTNTIFRYGNLPKTIDPKYIELYLQTRGHAVFAKVNDSYYVFTGGLSGEPDVYYHPSQYVIANPCLNLSRTFNISPYNPSLIQDAVIMENDPCMIGVIPILQRYITLILEMDITVKQQLIASRSPSIISAPDDRTAVSAKEYLKQLEEGDNGIVADNVFLDGIRVQPYLTSNNNRFIDFRDFYIFLKAQMYNEFGVIANSVEKSQYVSDSEIVSGNMSTFTFVEAMYIYRKRAVDAINEFFGLDITVDYDSIWKEQDESKELSVEEKEASIDAMESQPESNSDESEMKGTETTNATVQSQTA